MARSCSWGTGGANRNQKLTNSLLEQKYELLSALLVPAAAEQCASMITEGEQTVPRAPAPSKATILGAVNCSTPAFFLLLVEFFVSSWSIRRQSVHFKRESHQEWEECLVSETLCSLRCLIIFI